MFSENRTKDKILQSALQLINEYGYGGLTISELARQSNLSKQNIFYHYPEMETIFLELIQLWSTTGQQCTQEALANCHLAGAQRINAIVEGMFLWIQKYPELSKLGLAMFQSGMKIKKVKFFMDSAREIGRERILQVLKSDYRFKNLSNKKIEGLISGIHTLMYGNFLYISAIGDFQNLKIHEENCINNINHLISSSAEDL